MEEITIEEMVRRMMAMKEQHQVEVKQVLPIKIGNGAVNIFTQNFNKHGFDTGEGVQEWKEVKRRIPDTPEYKYPKKKGLSRRVSEILVRTGRGRRDVQNSLRSPRTSSTGIVIPFEVADNYMRYQNEGTEKIPMRKFIGNSPLLMKMIKEKAMESYERIFNAK